MVEFIRNLNLSGTPDIDSKNRCLAKASKIPILDAVKIIVQSGATFLSLFLMVVNISNAGYLMT